MRSAARHRRPQANTMALTATGQILPATHPAESIEQTTREPAQPIAGAGVPGHDGVPRGSSARLRQLPPLAILLADEFLRARLARLQPGRIPREPLAQPIRHR